MFELIIKIITIIIIKSQATQVILF